jgi:hypothetical protein
MRLRHASLAATVLGLVLAASAQAAPKTVSYSAAGGYAVNDCSHEIDCTPIFGYSGSSTCTKNCQAGAPAGGTFTINMTGSVAHPPGPCISKTVQGVVEVQWSDSTTTTASITGKFSKKKDGYVLKVAVTGGTNTAIPPGPPAMGFVSHPPSPCSPGSFAGSLAFRL